MYAVHAGITPATLDTLTVEPFGHIAFGHLVVTDGDGWNAWGEAPGTDVNDADTRHVLVHLDTLGEAIDLALEVAEFYTEHLVASTDPTHPGTLVTVSLAEEFSEQYLVINQTGAHLLASTLRD